MNSGTDLHNKFRTFADHVQGDFADFLFPTTGTKLLMSLVGEEKAALLDVIGAHSSHSLICHWRIDQGKGVGVVDQPVVWLDSEGWPNSVFTHNLADFLSLLPYDTGCIYDILSSWLNYKQDPGSASKPTDLYTDQRLKRYLESARESYEAYGDLLVWLSDNGIRTCEDPVGVVGRAIEECPGFSAWVREA